MDITSNEAALEYISEDLSQTPVVVDDHFHWSGLRPDYIAEVAALHAATLAGVTGGEE